MMGKPTKSLYFIALVPKGDLLDELWDLKREVSKTYDTKHALKSPPHVTLFMPFKWRDDREEKLIQHFSGIDKGALNLKLEGFNCFAPRVLYVDVELTETLEELYTQVKKLAQKLVPDQASSYKDRGFTPHLTIAFRDLRKSKFHEAWAFYKEKKYNAEQMIETVTLLKHNGQSWDIHHEFPLKR